MVSTRDAIGERGESIFVVRLTEFHGEKPIFRPTALGEKWPTTDFLVEVEDGNAFFFVQIKGTREGYDVSGRLKAGLSTHDAKLTATYPAPTYVVGVDVDTERAFLVSVNAEKEGGASSISTAHPLDEERRVALRNEVVEYWRALPKKLDSAFSDPDWR
jgi:hypothetical protein